MTQNTLNQILNQIETLEREELQQLNQTIQQHLIDKEKSDQRTLFHQSLLNAGLVKQIHHPDNEPIAERRLIQVEGKPVSETIIEERG